MAGPITRKYSAGSIIYFVNDIGEEIFVLQQGRIVLISSSLDQTEDIKEDVARGEFFGVKSALGHYPREETAQVLSDSLVLVFKVNEFEVFSLKNSRIVLQMLKVFSSQLRKIHKKVRELLGEPSAMENSIEMLRVAEYYYRSNKTDHALYVFQAYLRHFPDGSFAQRAQAMAQSIKKGDPYPLHMGDLEEEIDKVKGTVSLSAGSDMGYGTAMASDVSGEFDAPPLDDMNDHHEADESVSGIYHRGLDLFAQSRYSQAIEVFDQVLQTTSLSASETQYLERALFDQARAYLKNEEHDKAVEKLTYFLKKYPQSANQKKAMIFIANAYEKKGDKTRAISIYEKVAKMQPRDKDSIQAEKKARSLRGG